MTETVADALWQKPLFLFWMVKIPKICGYYL